ncbi:MAG: cytochrome b/b6 domain-containing protein [Rubrivivax sp.]|nr:cytochrome b/b6 domain-containing protein [Rubrivivax sp.]
MQTAPAFQPAAAGPSGTCAAPQRLVTDAPTRMFHWLFALSFVGAYLSAEGERWRALHVTLGYTLAGLLAFRVLYGLFGPRHASLGLLLRKLVSAPMWLRSVAQAISRRTTHGINWRQGQNLLMALAVVALLVMVVPLTLSGYGTYNGWGDFLGGDWLEDVHEFFGNAVLAVVLGHIALIVGLSVMRRKNQARPMLTGRIDGAGPDLVKRNHARLAALLLIAVVAFVGLEWQQSPNGLIPAQGTAPFPSDRHRDDDD